MVFISFGQGIITGEQSISSDDLSKSKTIVLSRSVASNDFELKIRWLDPITQQEIPYDKDSAKWGTTKIKMLSFQHTAVEQVKVKKGSSNNS